MNQIIGPGSQRKKIKIFNSPEEYFKSQEFQNDQKIEEEQKESLKENLNDIIPEQENQKSQIPLSTPIKYRYGYVYVPSINLFISEERHLQNKTWKKTHQLLHQEERRMPTLKEFVEFLKYLKTDDAKKTVKNLNKINDELYELKNPLRGEWIDANFENLKNNYVKYYTFENRDDGRIYVLNETLETYLEGENRRIDLESWLNNPTPQGLPKQYCKSGNFGYNAPQNESITLFYANKDLVKIECNFSSHYSDKNIGTRYVEL